MAGCKGASSASDTPGGSAAGESSQPSSVDANSILFHGDVTTEYISLTNLNAVSQDLLDRTITSSGMRLKSTTDASLLAENAKSGILMDYIGQLSWAQTILGQKLDKPNASGVKEGVLIDPSEEPLTSYDGVRFWANVKRPAGKETMHLQLIFFMGYWSTYRAGYQYSIILPDGDFEGYLTIPFDEMVNEYDTSTKACNKETIDYFAFKLVATKNEVVGVQIAVSDFSAYREVFWQ